MQGNKLLQFTSDNYDGVHPQVAEYINKSIELTEMPYGEDSYSNIIQKEFELAFQSPCDVHFMGTGTASNVTALRTALSSIDAVICTDVAHILQDECGAFENFIGAKLIPIPNSNGKLTERALEAFMGSYCPIRLNKVKMISITQATEFGTVYTPQEIKNICEFARKHNLYVHMDGARLANAVAYTKESLNSLTVGAGVDILSFGGTKNGALLAEAVVIFNPKLSSDFKFIHKQSMQLFSKMRFIPAQFLALFKNDLWLKNAENANYYAKKIKDGLVNLKYINVKYPVEANEIFLQMPLSLKNSFFKKYHFYTCLENQKEDYSIIRLVTSFKTKEIDVQNLLLTLNKCHSDYCNKI